MSAVDAADESRASRSMSYDVGAEAHKANMIASQAARDSDDFVAASRRHDRDFLHDVANKLVRPARDLSQLCYAIPVLFLRTSSARRVGIVTSQPPSPTQPFILSGTGNEYRPKGGDAVQLGGKGRCGSFHLWIKMLGKTG